jgi:hypothetical protein
MFFNDAFLAIGFTSRHCCGSSSLKPGFNDDMAAGGAGSGQARFV